MSTGPFRWYWDPPVYSQVDSLLTGYNGVAAKTRSCEQQCTAVLIAIPFAVATPLMPNETLAVCGLAVTSFLLAFPQGLPAAALQVIAPNRLRAQMTALYFLVGNLIALGIGPTMVALVTDYGFGDTNKLPYSMSLVCAIVIPLGVISVFFSLKPYRASVARAKAA